MKTLTKFKDSLNLDVPERDFSIQLQSLWYDCKGDWHKAHSLIDHLSDQSSAWVHAYLHRKEGDISNAGYWYRKAGQTFPDMTLEQEWEQLVLHFL